MKTQPTKEGSVSFRISVQMKEFLAKKAADNYMTLSNYLIQIIERYEQAISEKLDGEQLAQVVKDLSKENKSLRQGVAVYEDSKLAYYFKKFQGRRVHDRLIESKRDVFSIMVENFDLHQEVDEVLVSNQPVKLDAPQKLNLWAVLSSLFLLGGLLIFIFRGPLRIKCKTFR